MCQSVKIIFNGNAIPFFCHYARPPPILLFLSLVEPVRGRTVSQIPVAISPLIKPASNRPPIDNSVTISGIKAVIPPKTIPIPIAIKGTIFLGTPACLTNCVNAIVITEITVANAIILSISFTPYPK